MGTDSFFNERIKAIRTLLDYKHVATTIPLVTFSRRWMMSFMRTIDPPDTQSGVGQESDHED
jgi:hypothetical protein